MSNTPVELKQFADKVDQFRLYLQALQVEYNELQKEFSRITDKAKLKAVAQSLKVKK